MLSTICPNCAIVVKPILQQKVNYIGGIVNVGYCPSCNGPIITLTRENETTSYPYPKKFPELEKVPQNILSDFEEANKCFYVNAYKATLVLCRRIIQKLVRERGCKKDNLKKEIEYLKDNHIIPEDISDLAHEIRVCGNFGAHPDEDEDKLLNVVKEDAYNSLEFVKALLEYFYVRPAKVKEMRERRGRSKKDSQE